MQIKQKLSRQQHSLAAKDILSRYGAAKVSVTDTALCGDASYKPVHDVNPGDSRWLINNVHPGKQFPIYSR